MASLKEIKGRIASVEGTLKITSAMKMVASAKLHKAQQAIESMLPYDRLLQRIMSRLLSDKTQVVTPLCEVRAAKKRVAIVAVASNSSLCGGYNNNVVRFTSSIIDSFKAVPDIEQIECYVVGKKLEQALSKRTDIHLIRDFVGKGEHPSYETAEQLAQVLMDAYLQGHIDQVVLAYMHFKSTASQVATQAEFLPLSIEPGGVESAELPAEARYIIEPSPQEVLVTLIPDALRMKIFAMLLDAQAAEHAARTVAMQTATDNANELLDELRIQYNKGRQSAITAELLDIVGGSMQ